MYNSLNARSVRRTRPETSIIEYATPERATFPAVGQSGSLGSSSGLASSDRGLGFALPPPAQKKEGQRFRSDGSAPDFDFNLKTDERGSSSLDSEVRFWVKPMVFAFLFAYCGLVVQSAQRPVMDERSGMRFDDGQVKQQQERGAWYA